MLKTIATLIVSHSVFALESTTTTCGAIKALYQSEGNGLVSSCCDALDSDVRTIDPACAHMTFGNMTTDSLSVGPCFTIAVSDEAGKPPEMMPVCGEHQVFVNGRIIIMDGMESVVDAISVVGDRVHKYGTNMQIKQYITPSTKVHDLRGVTMTPGHVDGHAHFFYTALMIGRNIINVQPPPLGVVDSIDKVVETLKERIDELADDTTSTIRGFGFSDTLGGRPLETVDLDRVSTTRPVCVQHDSGHAMYLNSVALEQAKQMFADLGHPIPETSTKLVEFWTDPVSKLAGTIGYYPQDYEVVELRGKLDGAFWESTNSRIGGGAGPCGIPSTSGNPASGQQQLSHKALSRGITFLDESYSFGLPAESYANVQQKIQVKPITGAAGALIKADNPRPRPYKCTDMVVGNKVKIFVDGSPQGYTAHVTTPYHTPAAAGPFAGNASWVGFSQATVDGTYATMKRFHDLGWDIAVHTNADAAIDIGLDALERLYQETDRTPQRAEFIHCQFMRHDQILRMMRLGATCTYFNLHNYYYGDRHELRFFGPLRAKNSSPLKWAVDAGMHFTTHVDEPVTSAEPMMKMRTAMTRLTRSGRVLGKHQRIGFMDAMKASTIWSAEQAGADHCVGSLEPGKMFDAAIYDQDIMMMDPQDIYKAVVTQTWMNGKKMFDISINPSPFKRLALTLDVKTDAVLANNMTHSPLKSGMVKTSSPTPSTFEGVSGTSYGFPVSDHPGNNLP